MSFNNSSNSSEGLFDLVEIANPSPVRFWLFLLFNTPSIVCASCVIIHIIFNRTQRRALHNHCVLLILIFNLPIQLIDINLQIIFFHYGSVQPPLPSVCLIWWYIDYACYLGSMILMAWLAVERHILIFHDRWISNQRRCFLLHYAPMIIIAACILLFYLVNIFLLPCQNTFDYTLPICGENPCFESDAFPSKWESIVNGILPITLETFASVSFVIRVQLQSRRLSRLPQWRKTRRLTIQLSLMSAINICFNIPSCLISFAHYCGLPSQYGSQIQVYFTFLAYFITFLFPFVSLCQLPELRKRIKTKIFFLPPQHQSQIARVAPTLRRTQMPTVQ
ncbi:unnamed protein product [Rotaria magnacalcarata]|uniref:G-protein coupled receptors family 1 profile domain-containing protein n=1 Tax=Rotaria magnacalcarata TaxID=392030 RepID=A0A816GDC7_9BILA|nr:unnamed protein product [Rotaria magnacalcarata]CAF1673286.1 unnamed protein product [Rotaria magnacalcarata]CAF4022660.1 unnamed protein product [Rotaria magnacalcarata]CAF5072730.1 unnamed protein product [Rotaria magnacalcarata]